MVETVALVSGSVCLIASVGTFVTSFFIKPNAQAKVDNSEKIRNGLRISSAVLLTVSAVVFVFYFYKIGRKRLAKKLLNSLSEGRPDALEICDSYMESKGNDIHRQFRDFRAKVGSSGKLSPQEADYQVKNFCKTTAKTDLKLK
jgi:hypothetical protein